MTNMECSQQQAPQEQTPPAAEAQQQQRQKHQRIKLIEINPYLTCHLCQGYLIDATTISECLHSFCRSCIIKFLQDSSHCPVCEMTINKAKPNLKLDKTLQDIVYKLVPELFLSEMCRRQMFYRKQPEQAARVSPEQRGEDTERTIFNPRDTFSLSIEYISDDSTPGAILLPSTKANVEANKKNGLKEPSENMMRRFLQCPGMCRVDVLKKFVRNKYTVDTNRFHIDILYKRVPLPDHYTLIDIAYIYSWKRNEPMKFFFRITDLKLVKQRFDYLEPTVSLEPAPPQSTQTGQVQKSVTEEADKLKNGVYTNITLNRPNLEIITKIQKVSNKIGLNVIKQTAKSKKKKDLAVSATKKSPDTNELTQPPAQSEAQNGPVKTVQVPLGKNGAKNVLNIQNLHIIKKKNADQPEQQSTKIVVLSDKNASLAQDRKCVVRDSGKKTDLQTATNSTIQSDKIVHKNVKCVKSEKVKPPQVLNLLAKHEKIKAVQILNVKSESSPPKEPASPSKVKLDVPASPTKKAKMEVPDLMDGALKDKTLVVKSVNEIIKNNSVIPAVAAKSNDESSKVQTPLDLDVAKERFLKSIELTARNTLQTISQSQKKVMENKVVALKRRISSPQKAEKAAKKMKIEKKVRKKLAKAKLEKVEKKAPVENLKTLLNTCKIPSSLSITCVNGDRETQIKPVINHIEIVKLPEQKVEIDENKQKADLEKVGTTMKPTGAKEEDKAKESKEAKSELSITITIENSEKNESTTKPIGVHPNLPKMLPPVSTPRAPHSFQKMFEEAIKKPEFAEKIQADPVKGSSKGGENNSGNKRNILEIASQLYKKTKLEQEKNEKFLTNDAGKVAIPRLNHHKNLAKLLSPRSPVSKPVDSKKELSPNSQFANMHSASLGMNYTVSVNQREVSDKVKVSSVAKPDNCKERLNLPLPRAAPNKMKPQSSPRLLSSPSPGSSSPRQTPLSSPRPLQSSPRPSLSSPRPLQSSPRPSQSSPRPPTPLSSPRLVQTPTSLTSPRPSQSSPQLRPAPHHPQSSPQPRPSPHPPQSSPHPPTSLTSPQPSKSSSRPPASLTSPRLQPSPKSSPSQNVDPNQLLEKYNIQNLAQLTASFNFNPAGMGLTPANQIAAIHQAMIYKHLEMQNRQNWLSMNSNPIAQYEKYLQSLNANGQAHLLNNIKEN